MEKKIETTMVYWGYIGTSSEPLTTSRRPLFLVAWLLDEFRADMKPKVSCRRRKG